MSTLHWNSTLKFVINKIKPHQIAHSANIYCLGHWIWSVQKIESYNFPTIKYSIINLFCANLTKESWLGIRATQTKNSGSCTILAWGWQMLRCHSGTDLIWCSCKLGGDSLEMASSCSNMTVHKSTEQSS